MVVALTRTNLMARNLRGFAARSPEARAARHMLAVAVEGVDRKTATEKTCGIARGPLEPSVDERVSGSDVAVPGSGQFGIETTWVKE